MEPGHRLHEGQPGCNIVMRSVTGNGCSTFRGSKAGLLADVVCHPERLDQPIRWAKPRRIFVNSMSDLFHEEVPTGFIDEVFAVMALATQHTFQVLTKRPEKCAITCSIQP